MLEEATASVTPLWSSSFSCSALFSLSPTQKCLLPPATLPASPHHSGLSSSSSWDSFWHWQGNASLYLLIGGTNVLWHVWDNQLWRQGCSVGVEAPLVQAAHIHQRHQSKTGVKWQHSALLERLYYHMLVYCTSAKNLSEKATLKGEMAFLYNSFRFHVLRGRWQSVTHMNFPCSGAKLRLHIPTTYVHSGPTFDFSSRRL